ncbi:aminoglycoside phosphotransferase family protein [Paenibacillus sp. GCM10027629]|uniref:aminoglycoside phosphotransferase family protein n=1 Tax=Paenibacillus sp. GCM10027629 TaxID=3273414 RepID=UPI003630F327
MQIEEIMLELREQGVIAPHINTWKALSGGTVSTVYALISDGVPMLVVKINDPKTVQFESSYLRAHKGNPLFARVVYIDADYRYFVYTYQPGETEYPRDRKAETLQTLVREVINRSIPMVDSSDFGYADEPSASWKEFLMLRYQWAHETIDTRLSSADHKLAQQLIHSTQDQALQYLLHGDCGVHNFLFQQGQLTGVIDPIPTIGEPLYDLIYAFCSSPDQLDADTIQLAVERMDPMFTHGRDLKSEVIIGLYFRIATCILHHPQDFEVYIEAWEYWKKRK